MSILNEAISDVWRVLGLFGSELRVINLLKSSIVIRSKEGPLDSIIGWFCLIND